MHGKRNLTKPSPGGVGGLLIVVGVFVGGFGGDEGSLTMVRIANGLVSLGFLVIFLGTLIRPVHRTSGSVAKSVVFGALTLLFGYFVYNAWLTMPAYEIVAIIMDL